MSGNAPLPFKGGCSQPPMRAQWILVTAFVLTLMACSKPESSVPYQGKWKSSKLTMPIYLYANGEWEIKTNEGAVLQYGIWELKNSKIIWSYKMGDRLSQEGDLIVSVKPAEFQLRESDGSTTTFTQLESKIAGAANP